MGSPRRRCGRHGHGRMTTCCVRVRFNTREPHLLPSTVVPQLFLSVLSAGLSLSPAFVVQKLYPQFVRTAYKLSHVADRISVLCSCFGYISSHLVSQSSHLVYSGDTHWCASQVPFLSFCLSLCHAKRKSKCISDPLQSSQGDQKNQRRVGYARNEHQIKKLSTSLQ